MHPIERLRQLARARTVEHRVLVQESAPALAALAANAGALVLSCRRLVQHHPASGPLVWLCARVLSAEDRRAEVWRCAGEIEHDATATHLGAELPELATVVVIGWPEVAVTALARRGDARLLVVDAGGEGAELASRLRSLDVDAVEVPEAGTAAAVGAADLVLLEADAVGDGGAVAASGSYAAAAVASHTATPVWLVAGVGRCLPPGLWSGLAGRLERPAPWTASVEVVPPGLVDVVVRPSGPVAGPMAAQVPDCPDAPELR